MIKLSWKKKRKKKERLKLLAIFNSLYSFLYYSSFSKLEKQYNCCLQTLLAIFSAALVLCSTFLSLDVLFPQTLNP